MGNSSRCRIVFVAIPGLPLSIPCSLSPQNYKAHPELIALIVSQHEMIAGQEGIIAAQQERIAALEVTVAQLTARVGEVLAALAAIRDETAGGTGRPQWMPGLKPAAAKVRPPKKVRTWREQQCVRHRMEPTVRVIHALNACPICGMPLVGGSVKRTREVIAVPLVPVVVTEHVSVERCCPHCHTRHTPLVDLGEAVVGKQRFGVGLMSLIATIQWYLRTFHSVSVSVGALIGALRQVARAGKGAVDVIREEIRGSPCVHGDETGWREDGVNGYV